MIGPISLQPGNLRQQITASQSQSNTQRKEQRAAQILFAKLKNRV